MKIVIAVALFFLAFPAAAQWAAGNTIDYEITDASLGAWSAAHGDDLVERHDDGAIVVRNPYDHRGAERIAVYRPVNSDVPVFGNRQHRFAFYAIDSITGPDTAQQLDDVDHVLIVFHDLLHTGRAHARLPLVVSGLIGAVIAFLLARALRPRHLGTTSLAWEVERRFLGGVR